MGRSQETYNKKEREKKKQKKKKDKAEKREQRKLDLEEGRNTQPQFMYLDEDGNLSPTPPDPLKKSKVKLEDIEISIPKQDKDDTQDHRKIGVVKFFNREKGYGFINEKGSHESVFVHMDGLIDQIKENDKVIFEVRRGPKGLIAEGVKIYVAPTPPTPAPEGEVNDADSKDETVEAEDVVSEDNKDEEVA
jgi:cold shock CspA family protein